MDFGIKEQESKMSFEILDDHKVNIYINRIAESVLKEINILERAFLFLTKDNRIHHWKICLYIRNKYIYTNSDLMSLNIDPDELSYIVLKRLFKPSKKK